MMNLSVSLSVDYIGYFQGTKDADEVRIRKLHFL